MVEGVGPDRHRDPIREGGAGADFDAIFEPSGLPWNAMDATETLRELWNTRHGDRLSLVDA